MARTQLTVQREIIGSPAHSRSEPAFTVRTRVNKYSVRPRGNQKEQSNTACHSKDCTVVEDSCMADPIPKQTGNDARHELQQSDGCAVPADPLARRYSGT